MEQSIEVNHCLIHSQKFKHKPNNHFAGMVQKTWKSKSYWSNDLREIASALAQGQTVMFNKKKLDTIIIDIDKTSLPFEECLAKLINTIKIKPDIAYESFSSVPRIKCYSYRLIFFLGWEITQKEYFEFTDNIAKKLSVEVDYSFCFNPKQICFGTNKKVYANLGRIKNTPNDFKPSYKSLHTNSKILLLENKSYNDFKQTLNNILATKQHIGYELCLRWFFAEVFDSTKQLKILSLASSDTQKKVLNLSKRRNSVEYGFKLFVPQGNFYRLRKENEEKLKWRMRAAQ